MTGDARAARLAAFIALILERPAALRATVRWPCFSVTCYRMVDDLRRQGIRPRTVIDVGANVGQFACAALELWDVDVFHAFEPLKEAHQLLERHLARYRMAKLHSVAVGAEEGLLTLHVNAHSHSSSLLALGDGHRAAFPEAQPVADVQVSVRTLDVELAAEALTPPALLKLDVQGYERCVLDGGHATLRRIEWVVVELSFRPMYEGELSFLDMVAYMDRQGFRLVRPVGWLAAPATGEILQCDALFHRAALGTP